MLTDKPQMFKLAQIIFFKDQTIANVVYMDHMFA